MNERTPSQTQPVEGTQLRREHWHTLTAGFLGWTLDAFDFFVVVFLIEILSRQFSVGKKEVIWTLMATLAMRPVGAFLFGLFADRYGRRRALMANVVFYSLVEVLCGFSPNFGVFLTLRALYGIGMGGEWGVGASLTMESAPRRSRGLLSGILQSGYPIGYLLAAVAARFVLPIWGWRAMFWVGGLPALLALYIRAKVPESAVWIEHHEHSVRAILKTVSANAKGFAYLVVLMTLMNFLSHGTQDLYPDFLKTEHGVSAAGVSTIAIIYNLGAVLGALVFGHFSEGIGRRGSMVAALVLSLAVIPLWAFGHSAWALGVGALFMQAGVQGAWGIIPVHLNELSPDTARSLLPGLAYQLGILIAAPTNTIEYALRDRLGYAWAMAGFEAAVIVLDALVISLGPEKRGKDFARVARPFLPTPGG